MSGAKESKSEQEMAQDWNRPLAPRISPRFQPIRTSFGLWMEDASMVDDTEIPQTQTGALRCYSRESTADFMMGRCESRAGLMQKRAAVLEHHSQLFGVTPPGAHVL